LEHAVNLGERRPLIAHVLDDVASHHARDTVDLERQRLGARADEWDIVEPLFVEPLPRHEQPSHCNVDPAGPR
jgi:hypothetical protein